MTDGDIEFDTGSSVLVNTPPSFDDVQANGPDTLHSETNALVAVTYDQSADAFLQTWRRRTGTDPDFVRLIEVGGTMRSVAGETPYEPSTQNAVETVQRPNDLHGIRTAIESALGDADGETTFVFDSLTSAFEHVPLHEMVPFFQAISNRLTDANAVGYFYYDDRSNGPSLAPFRALADGTVGFDDGSEGTVDSHTTSGRDGPALDVMFEVLSSRRRRDVLRHLLDTGEAVDIDELATAVARHAPGEGTMTRKQHRRCYATLYQLHLPKLDSAGLVDHDERSHRVSIRENARWAESFLALVEE